MFSTDKPAISAVNVNRLRKTHNSASGICSNLMQNRMCSQIPQKGFAFFRPVVSNYGI